MYSQTPSELPSGYSGSAFQRTPEEELDRETECRESTEVGAIAEGRQRRPFLSFLDRFHVGRYLKGFDLEDLLILALALLLLLEDGEGDLFPLLLLFLLLE